MDIKLQSYQKKEFDESEIKIKYKLLFKIKKNIKTSYKFILI